MDHARTYQMGTCPKCRRRFRLTLEADKECLCKRCFWAEIEASMRKIERWNEEDRERRSSLPPRYEDWSTTPRLKAGGLLDRTSREQ